MVEPGGVSRASFYRYGGDAALVRSAPGIG